MSDNGENFLVLVNERNEHCMWAAFMEVPLGWEIHYGPDGDEQCLDYVRKHWSVT